MSRARVDIRLKLSRISTIEKAAQGRLMRALHGVLESTALVGRVAVLFPEWRDGDSPGSLLSLVGTEMDLLQALARLEPLRNLTDDGLAEMSWRDFEEAGEKWMFVRRRPGDSGLGRAKIKERGRDPEHERRHRETRRRSIKIPITSNSNGGHYTLFITREPFNERCFSEPNSYGLGKASGAGERDGTCEDARHGKAEELSGNG